MSKHKKEKTSLKSQITFDVKIAKGFSKTDYYKAQAQDNRQQEFLDSEKIRLSTPKWEYVSQLLAHYTNLGATQTSSAGTILQGIYDRNKKAALSSTICTNSKILSVVAKPEILMLAYRMIKGNKGALTTAGSVSREVYNAMDNTQKELYLKSFELPDGMNLYWISQISNLLRKGKYPWGSSKRVYVDKPGQPGKLRPITIPPFTDKMVQKAIAMVLEAIYEPSFEKMNRSFGFRPNKGCLDALTALLSDKTNGMRTAIEGDIQGAYDTVDKSILVRLLSKKINDRKFLKFIEDRLQYNFFDPQTEKREEPKDGIPQGGIDSPYLFNIYMYEMDCFVQTELQQEIDRLNKRLEVEDKKSPRTFSKMYNSSRALGKKILRHAQKVKKMLNSLPLDHTSPSVRALRKRLFKLCKQKRLQNHHKNKLSSASNNNRLLRIFYTRYADDWVLLTNGNKEIATILKEKIATFLKETLKLTLSPNKTLITDITREPAKFLGYELRTSARGAIIRQEVSKTSSKKRFNLHKRSGLLLWAAPDRQRMINRYHMKGFCSDKGFPKTLPWLSCLEAHAIIDRFNATIRGSAQYYLPIIRNRARIHRWVYILRFACLHTLAQKYKCSISKIFKRFGHNLHSKKDQTISVRVEQTNRGETYYKEWTLLTYSDLVNNDTHLQQRKQLMETFWERERGAIGDYQLKPGKVPTVTNDNFLEKITWVSWRTLASLDMPCASCGKNENVHQHHIKHIRKRSYKLIPEAQSYQRMMALRNRKQIPLCQECHIGLVHGGKYNGGRLIHLAPITKLVDNRVIHVESFVQPGAEHHAKSLTDKGWKKSTSNTDQKTSFSTPPTLTRANRIPKDNLVSPPPSPLRR